jgi:hypothetical protein
MDKENVVTAKAKRLIMKITIGGLLSSIDRNTDEYVCTILKKVRQ